MKKNGDDLVRFQLDPANLPSLTEVQRAELAALKGMQDCDIDYSDIASVGQDFWKNARRGLFYKPFKH